MKQKKTKKPRKSTTSPRKRKPRKSSSREATQALTRKPKRVEENSPRSPTPSFWAKGDVRELPGDLPSVTVKDEAEALFYFRRIDDRLAEAWKRDVVMHEGPITIRRALSSRFGSTHYAYVDPRLLWYLKHDPSDPLGAKWEGYLKSAGDAPRGAIAVFVGRDVVAKKCPPLLEDGPR